MRGADVADEPEDPVGGADGPECLLVAAEGAQASPRHDAVRTRLSSVSTGKTTAQTGG